LDTEALQGGGIGDRFRLREYVAWTAFAHPLALTFIIENKKNKKNKKKSLPASSDPIDRPDEPESCDAQIEPLAVASDGAPLWAGPW